MKMIAFLSVCIGIFISISILKRSTVTRNKTEGLTFIGVSLLPGYFAWHWWAVDKSIFTLICTFSIVTLLYGVSKVIKIKAKDLT
jgi:hypothetical protein